MHKSKPPQEDASGGPRREETPCPNCSSSRVVPILYGYPMGPMVDEVERGEAVLGGCLMSGNDPMKFCLNCETSFDYGEAPLSGAAAYVVSPEEAARSRQEPWG